MKTVKVTVLVENSVGLAGLKAEHGLSWLVEIGSRRVLFDTGQTDLIIGNAAALGCSLSDLDAVVLSHGHYDHTGGLSVVSRHSPQARLFLHPDAAESKFTVNRDGSPRFVGMPEPSRQVVANAQGRMVRTSKCEEVVEGLQVTGEVPRASCFEDVGGRFFKDRDLQRPDLLMDDQALFFSSPEGTVVLLGCAHAGVVNTLRQIHRLTDGAPFRAVLGGMHLVNASEARIDATIQALREMEVPTLYPGHCTGLPATVRLWTAFPGRCKRMEVGSQFVW